MRRILLAAFNLIVFAAVVAVGAVYLQRRPAAPGQLTISWTDNTKGRAQTKIERRTKEGTEFVVVATVAPGATTYVDTALRAGTTYCYRTRAIDSTKSEESAYSETVCGVAR